MSFEFSIVAPMYDVARYLPDFFASLEAQTYGLDRVEVLLVDDGSTDDTLRLAKGFEAAHPSNVRVLHQVNAGQAAARNAGIAAATGTWLTFPDPDDVLAPGYLAAVAEFMASDSGAGAAVYSARISMWDEGSDTVTDSHPLAFRFHDGERVADLGRHPELIQPHITSGFMRRDVVAANGLRLDERLRLRFEDGGFISKYLLAATTATVGFVPGAEYRYRQRSDQSSTVQSSGADPRKYTDTIRYGFFDVIAFARAQGIDRLPRWTQNLFLYDQFWILRSSRAGTARQSTFPEEMYRELDELIPRFLAQIDDDAIREFDVMPVDDWMRDAFLLVKRGSGATTPVIGAVDRARGLKAVEYRFLGEPPHEQVLVDGESAEARHVKTEGLEYAGRPIVWGRTLWVPLGASVDVVLDGRLHHPRPSSSVEPEPEPAVRARVTRLLRAARRVGARRTTGLGGRIIAARLLALLPSVRARYRDAWVFLDRDVDANDSAEMLYTWVAAHRPAVNAWFVVRKGTADWDRLDAAGVRLVGYGTPSFFVLLMHARHLASSHADRFVSNPLPRSLGSPRWTFTFLQHGVIKGDISGWLNAKQIGVFVASTQDEYDYITGPSPYRFGTKEVRLTGLPRFDDLLAQDRAIDPAERDVVLVAPTWRDYLVGDMGGTSNERAVRDDFETTAYAQSIRALLASDALEQAARAAGARIVFMPHPNMHAYLGRFGLPPHVTVLGYDDVDIRSIVARSRVMVTDYSSIAFNMAYLHRPVVYFHFDRDEYYAGHTERPGYFDYETHGFGPVTRDVADTVHAVARVLDDSLDDRYAERMARTFPVRDGRNSERVFAAMVEATTMRPLAERATAAPADSWADAEQAVRRDSA